jgi:cyclopropane fatty-acyl-phospholipid synthase-like methyltransferase
MTEGTVDERERWAKRYTAPGYLFGTEPNAFLKSHADLLRKGQSALAIADGEGRNGVFLAEQGLDVLSLDFSDVAQEKARVLAKSRGVALRLQQADMTAWNWTAETFDVVVGIFIQFAKPADRAVMFAGIKKTLKPGGLLLLQGYGLKQLEYKTGGPSEPERLYTRTMLEEAFGDFTSLEIADHDSALKEGDHHVGMSALVDLVGRK